jgi:hypothetical protein
MLDAILNPDFKGDMSAFENKLSAWETRVVLYESGLNKKIDDDLKRAVLLRNAPHAVAEHLKINISQFKTYADMRKALDAYFVAKRDYKPDKADFMPESGHSQQQHPMEVDAIGHGKGGKAGKGGKDGKNDKRGKGKVDTQHPGKGKSTELKCTHCHRFGHDVSTCWFKDSGKAKGKSGKKGGKGGRKGMDVNAVNDVAGGPPAAVEKLGLQCTLEQSRSGAHL